MASIVTSRALGPEAKGVYASILIVPLTIKSFFEMGVRQSTMYYMGRGAYDEKLYISSVFGLYLITTFASVCFTLFVFYVLGNNA